MKIESLKGMVTTIIWNYMIIVLLGCGSTAFAQQEWQPHQNGTDIYYNEGNVGIGTDTPTTKLDVNGSIKVPSTNWSGFYFGDTYSGLAWRPFGGGIPAITSHTLALGDDGFLAQIYYDTIWDGSFAYCEGVTDTDTPSYMVNCSNYAGTMTSNDHFWVWKNGYNPNVASTKDLKFVFDGESNDGTMGFMEDEDAFYFNEKVGIGTTTPAEKLSVDGTIQSLNGGFKFPDGTIQTTSSEMIKENVTLNVPADFADINAALAFLSDKIIADGVYVLIQVANGSYNYSGSINVTHRDGDKIAIMGNSSSPSLCKITFASGVTGLNVVHGNKLGRIEGFEFVSAGSANHGFYVGEHSYAFLENMIINGFNYNITANIGSTVLLISGVTVKNASYSGMGAYRGSTIYAISSTADDNGTGYDAQSGSTIDASSSTARNNVIGFKASLGSFVNAVSVTNSNNGTNFSPAANTMGGNDNSYVKN